MNAVSDLIAGYPVLFWLGLGIALLVLEIVLYPGFFLSFAVGAFIVALGTLLGLLPIDLLWKALIFAVIGVITIPLFRNVLRRYLDRTPDINKY
jgi:membrane protein implicated in regulation of membrane protease activity